MRTEEKKEKFRQYQRWYAQEHKPWLKWYQEHKEKERLRSRERHRKLKAEVLTHYSITTFPICARCKITDVDVLCLDHINGNGNKERGHKGVAFYQYLKSNKFPSIGLQVLCANCNLKKRIREDFNAASRQR